MNLSGLRGADAPVYAPNADRETTPDWSKGPTGDRLSLGCRGVTQRRPVRRRAWRSARSPGGDTRHTRRACRHIPDQPNPIPVRAHVVRDGGAEEWIDGLARRWTN